MNIKNIKALKEAKVYSEHFVGQNFIVEDIPPPDNARCMPYYSWVIPTPEQLINLITGYNTQYKIEVEATEMGFMMYSVVVTRGVQDAVEETFSEPFLDDALASALLALKEDADAKKQMRYDMDNVEAHCFVSERSPDGDCTFTDNNHKKHPKG